MVFDRFISFVMRDKIFKHPDSRLREYLKELISKEKYNLKSRRREGEWGADCGYDGASITSLTEITGNPNKIIGCVSELIEKYDKDKPGFWTPEHLPLEKISVRKKAGGKIRLKIGQCPLIYTVKLDPVK